MDDGAGRAAQIVMGRLLRRFDILSEEEARDLGCVLRAPVHNRPGLTVGEVRPSGSLPF